MARNKNPYRTYASIIMASLLLLCVLALAACGTSASTNSATSATSTTGTTTSSQTTSSPADNATKIKNVDQQVQDAINTIDSTQKDVNTTSQSNSDNDQTP
ncbi:hypothetical protein [Dictyobacter kobayashii]|uniref:Uncharacterized protein n=1 Tax=Dictyobacter kobayashii TaxID=2014872 RepID=A0A402AKW4_9CHLR|nr:hypothetical protein [Dictyobacter kobayashii]GCE19766.1 hypothetical protein KDK_35660 [Dictyobacter kobayashii]